MAKEVEKTVRNNDEPKAAARTTVEPKAAEDTRNPSQQVPYPDGNPADPYAAKLIAHPKAMEDEEPPPEIRKAEARPDPGTRSTDDFRGKK